MEKKNGKGKVYYKGELVFEGEYLKGKKMEMENNILKVNCYSKGNF